MMNECASVSNMSDWSEEPVDFNSWFSWTRQLNLSIQSDRGNSLTSRATISFSSNLLREVGLSRNANSKIMQKASRKTANIKGIVPCNHSSRHTMKDMHVGFHFGGL